jgi:hypothetical protein
VVQLQFLNGAKAGTRWVACRLPFQVGRSAQDELRAEDDGVWEHHCRMELRDDHRIALVAADEPLTTVNGQSLKEAILRNGDTIELGSLRLQFSLSPTKHRGLRFRESMTWMGLAVLALAQVALIYVLAVEL